MGDILTGESAGEHVDRLNVSPFDALNVSVVSDAGPVSPQDGVTGLFPAVGIMLHMPGDSEAGALEP